MYLLIHNRILITFFRDKTRRQFIEIESDQFADISVLCSEATFIWFSPNTIICNVANLTATECVGGLIFIVHALSKIAIV